MWIKNILQHYNIYYSFKIKENDYLLIYNLLICLSWKCCIEKIIPFRRIISLKFHGQWFDLLHHCIEIYFAFLRLLTLLLSYFLQRYQSFFKNIVVVVVIFMGGLPSLELSFQIHVSFMNFVCSFKHLWKKKLTDILIFSIQ